MLPLMDAIASYLADAKAANLSPTTLKTYGAWLRRFARWLGAEATAPDFTPLACARFLRSLTESGIRPRTVKCCLHALRALGAWGVALQLWRENPAGTLKPPKLDATRREVCSDSEVADVLTACSRLPDRRRAALASAVMTTLVHAGLRRGELLALRVEDVNLGARRIEIRHGKGDKARTAYPHEECIEALRGWLRVRGACQHDFLWDYDGARRLGDVGLRTLLREVYAIAGYRDTPRLLPHSLRHNYATRLLRATGDVETVRAALGHDSILTTQVYLHADEARLQQVAQMTSLQLDGGGARIPARQDVPETRRQSAWRRTVMDRRS